jgi:hypothetical protein
MITQYHTALSCATNRFADYKVGEIGISRVTLAELEFGVANSQHQEKNQAALDKFVSPLEIANLNPVNLSRQLAYTLSGCYRARNWWDTPSVC